MAESMTPEFPERRSGWMRDVEIISSRQCESLSNALIQDELEAEIFQKGFSVKAVSDERLYGVFPARVMTNYRHEKHTLLFDRLTVDALTDAFAESYKVTESEITELYIGTGIAAHLLATRIREQNRARVQRINNVLTDPDSILTAMRTTDIIPEEKRWDAIQSIMQSDDRRIGNLNVLRFAFGMVYLQPETPDNVKQSKVEAEPMEQRIMLRFRQGLVETLQHKPTYLQVGEYFGRHAQSESSGNSADDILKEDFTFVGDKVFADAMGEFELAACFPMHWNELSKVLTICK